MRLKTILIPSLCSSGFFLHEDILLAKSEEVRIK
jgi:hypothetical protein